MFDATTTRAELLEMGRSAAQLKHYPLAEIYFQEMLLRYSNDVEAMWELARLYKSTGRLEPARSMLKRAIVLAPSRFDIADMLSEIENNLRVAISREVDSLMTRGEYEAALPRIGVLQSIRAEDPDVLARRARCLVGLGQLQAALSTADLALQKKSRPDLHQLRASIQEKIETSRVDDLESSARRLLASGDWVDQEAMDVLQTILARDPGNQWAREQFRMLTVRHTPPTEPVKEPSFGSNVTRVMREAAPDVGAFLDRHFGVIILLVTVLALVRSPLARSLAGRIHEPATFAGNLEQLDISEVLHLANVSALTGTLHIRTPDGKARVYMKDGEPHHCTAPDLTGLEALLWVITRVEQGAFELRTTRRDVERTIEQPLGLLLAGQTSATTEARAVRASKKSRMSELLETRSD